VNQEERITWPKLFMVFIIVLALGMLVAFCTVEPNTAYADERVVVAVRNFGKPMEPLAPAFTNDPERIVLSQNFYSTQPGARQSRNGVVQSFNYSALKTQSADAIATFGGQDDSAAIVFMAGGKWWYTFYGAYSGGQLQYVSSVAAPREVRPYSPGTIYYDTTGASFIVGSNQPAYFTRHLQPNDTLYLESPLDTAVVKYVFSDGELRVDTLNGITFHTSDPWHASRVYVGSDPWLYSSGQYIYSGSTKDAPQVIFNKDDTVFIRPLVMVDSFVVDAIRSVYKDSVGGSETRRSSEVAGGGDTVIVEMQLVSRRANWLPDQWLVSDAGSPVTYFVRLGFYDDTAKGYLGRFYTIRGNTDTSIFLASWFRDTIVNGLSAAERTALQPLRTDTLDSVITAFPLIYHAYIYAASGSFDVVLADTSTPQATLFGRGAIWKVPDPAPPLIDTAQFANYLHFLHLTKDDVQFPAYTAGRDQIKTYTIGRRLSTSWGAPGAVIGVPLSQSELPVGDTIIAYREESHLRGEFLPGKYQGWEVWGIWTIKTVISKRPVQASFVNDAYYPVRYAKRIGDTLFFVVSAANLDMVADTSRDTTSNWEIVKVGMPSWSGMTSWGNPPQLVAWGDTSSPSLLSFAQPSDPWNWTALNDVNIGLTSSGPVVGVIGFDDQLLAYKQNSITGFNGSQFTEISQGDGLIARDALTADNKRAFWLDIDGPKMISRRDFSGYTIQKIGKALDPVFNAWSSGFFGSSVVPFYVNPAYRSQALMRYNEYDEHLYLWFAEGSATTNNRCLTMNLATGEWDGLFTNGASAAMPMVWDDTTGLLFARNDTARVMRTSGNFNDGGVGITSDLRSGRFWNTDEKGWPISTTLQAVRFTGRGSDVLYDTLRLSVYVNRSMSGNITTAAADSVILDMATSVADGQFTWYPSSDLTGVYWEWRIYVDGGTTGTLFAPYEMLFEFSAPSREK
jgi:hypothetical protein